MNALVEWLYPFLAALEQHESKRILKVMRKVKIFWHRQKSRKECVNKEMSGNNNDSVEYEEWGVKRFGQLVTNMKIRIKGLKNVIKERMFPHKISWVVEWNYLYKGVCMV